MRPRNTTAQNIAFERADEMIDFAVTWRHWGGGSPEEIFVRFGISVHEYFARLELLLERGHCARQPQLRDELRQLCANRYRDLMANQVGL